MTFTWNFRSATKGGRFTGMPNPLVSFSIPWRPSPWRSSPTASTGAGSSGSPSANRSCASTTSGSGSSSLLVNGLLQVKTFRDLYPGIMHGLIFFGFLVLFIGTALIAKETYITGPLLGWFFLRGTFYLVFSFLMDLFGLAVLIGVLAGHRPALHPAARPASAIRESRTTPQMTRSYCCCFWGSS